MDERFGIALLLLFLLGANQGFAKNESKTLTIIHTNDIQSRLLEFESSRAQMTVGGIARVATVIKSLKQKSPETTLVIDGGDFLMGTLFHTIAREESAELRLMHEIGYDVAALGNHEFDFRPDGLAQIIRTAQSKSGLPQLVLANAVFSETDDRDDALQALFNQGVIDEYVIFNKNGLRIGVFGLMGKDAAEVSPFAAPIKFADAIESAKRMVKILREKENVDVVICASHSGVWKKPGESEWGGEDVKLAREVPGIDVVVGGHSHTLLREPVMVNGTPVIQAGDECRYVGVLDLKIQQRNIMMEDYRIIEINDTIDADQAIQAKVDSFKTKVTNLFLAPNGFSFVQVLAETGFDLTEKTDDCNLGNLVSDAMRWGIDRYEFDPAKPETKTDIAIVANGVIRTQLTKNENGLLRVSDLFRVLPLGIGFADDRPGYPLISFYITAEEIKRAMEVITTIAPLKGPSYFIQPSGLRFRYNPNRMLFDRVIDIEIGDESDGYTPLDLSSDNQRLYKIGCDIYAGSFIKVIGDFTYGVLEIIPKNSAGEPIDDLLNAMVDADPDTPGIQEAKEWEAFLSYIKIFADRDGNGIPDIPLRYRQPQGRIVQASSWNPTLLYKNATYLMWSASFIILIIVTGVSWITMRVLKKRLRQ